MTYRITEKDLELLVRRLNKLTSSPETAYTKTEDGMKANIGHFHLYHAYGHVGLHRMHNEGGGVEEIFSLGTKKELYDRLHAYIDGIELSKGSSS